VIVVRTRDRPRGEASARVRIVRNDEDVQESDAATARHGLHRGAIRATRFVGVEHDDMPLGKQLVHQRLRKREHRAILLVRVRRCDEEAAAQVVGRHVRRAESGARSRAQCVSPTPGKPISMTSAGRRSAARARRSPLAAADQLAAVLGERARLRVGGRHASRERLHVEPAVSCREAELTERIARRRGLIPWSLLVADDDRSLVALSGEEDGVAGLRAP